MTRRKRHKNIFISQELYDEIIEHRNELTEIKISYIGKKHTEKSN